jgi:hypothetical protein
MIRRLLLALPFLFLAPAASAQTEDFGAWMTFSLNKDLAGDLQFNFDQEFRLRDNLSTVNLLYTNLGLSYKFSKAFKLGVSYRFINKHKEDLTWGNRHRLQTDFVFKVKPGRFTLGYRARFQAEVRGYGYSGEYGNVPEIYMRNLFKAGYKVNDMVSPYVGTELRWQIQNPRIPYHDGFDRSRFIGGVDLTFTDVQTLGLYVLLQKEWNVMDPQTLYILGVEYVINLD